MYVISGEISDTISKTQCSDSGDVHISNDLTLLHYVLSFDGLWATTSIIYTIQCDLIMCVINELTKNSAYESLGRL